MEGSNSSWLEEICNPDHQQEEEKMRMVFNPSLEGILGSTMLAAGVAALILSAIYTSTVLAFIGLGLAFWGAVLIYIKGTDYVKKSILEATILPLLTTLSQTLEEIGYRGKAVYLPPSYLKNPEDSRVYVSKREGTNRPTMDEVQLLESQSSISNSRGMLITPPGAGLARLFEKGLGTEFIRTDLEFLKQRMHKLLVDVLELATDFQIQLILSETEPADVEKPNSVIGPRMAIIKVRIVSPIFGEMHEETTKLSGFHSSLGSPISSALACAFAKATGKPTIIEKEEVSEDGREVETQYMMLEP